MTDSMIHIPDDVRAMVRAADIFLLAAWKRSATEPAWIEAIRQELQRRS